MSYARLKMQTPNGNVVDLNVDGDNETLLPNVLTLEAQAEELGFTGFAMRATQPTPDAPVAPVGTEEQVLDPSQGKPGQLHRRFRLAVIEVTPRQDGKAKVDFYGDDKKPPMNDYPYATQVYKNETWVKQFADICNFSPGDFAVAARYAVVADVEVRFGDKIAERSGNYYRNVTDIRLAPGTSFQEVTRFESAEEDAAQDEVPF